MIVVDASVLAPALGDDGDDGRIARVQLVHEELIAPELIDLEVLSVWRRTLRASHRAAVAVGLLREIPLRRVSHTALVDRCWELRDDTSAYDASYIAVAELFGVRLLTADRRLARNASATCEITVVPRSR